VRENVKCAMELVDMVSLVHRKKLVFIILDFVLHARVRVKPIYKPSAVLVKEKEVLINLVL
jgi:hypothetical protein